MDAETEGEMTVGGAGDIEFVGVGEVGGIAIGRAEPDGERRAERVNDFETPTVCIY